MQTRVRIWDAPTRLFHWALVLCVVGLVTTAQVGGEAMTWHFRLGYAVAVLLAFRLTWGVVGGHWSRFRQFVRGPSAVWLYLKGQGAPTDDVGHNPLGALSVLALLTLLAAQVGTGLMSDDEIAAAGPLVKWVSSAWVAAATAYHKGYGKPMLLALIGLHLAAIAFHRFWRGDRLVAAMLHGDKLLRSPVPCSRDDARSRLLALGILAAWTLLAWLVLNRLDT